MDNQITAQGILESYKEITIKQQFSNSIFLINLFNKDFLLIYLNNDRLGNMPQIFLYNDECFDFPHIMLVEEDMDDLPFLPKGVYRHVCLYENESVVYSLMNFSEKLKDVLNRLINLLKMNKMSREKEFKKEFLYYWNNESSGDSMSIYLKQDKCFSKMEAYYSDTEIRLIEEGMCLSDLKNKEHGQRKWKHHIETKVYSIPIIDNRGILPPHRGYKWDVNTIKDIVYGKQIDHISHDTYQHIKNEMINSMEVILVFTMIVEVSKVTFATKLKFRNSSVKPLMDKICEDVVSVVPLRTVRKDFGYLSEQIGNDDKLRNKRILLIGCGSLGSYVAVELVKNGVTSLTIYDGDNLEDANTLRWAYAGCGIGLNKAVLMGVLSSSIHPEIQVTMINENIDEATLIKEMSKFDLIIFTIGSSDYQLKFNKALKENECHTPVIYAWLEAGGVYSHILVVDYCKEGCYECLYTGDNGKLVNNRATISDEDTLEKNILRNGCGGTRAAYGTSVLLRTTAVLLNTIQELFMGEINTNLLINISPDNVNKSFNIIPAKGCNCCGDRE